MLTAAMSKKHIILLIIACILAVILYRYLNPDIVEGAPLDDFAQCLAAKGATMYGNYNCPHCQNEKEAFGSSFEYINYVECAETPKECISHGVEAVPMWIFSDGRKLVGEQGIKKLSEESSCPLPQGLSQ